MSVRLRLKRVGMTKQPAYRLVAVDRRTARDGAELEILGTYNPKDKENRLIIKEERIKYWIEKGVQLSDTVHNFLVDQKIVIGKKINVLPKKEMIP